MNNRFWFVLLVLSLVGLVSLRAADPQSANEGQNFAAEGADLKALQSYLAHRRESIERKGRFAKKLRDRLNAALKKPKSSGNERQVSLLAYELFATEVRLSGDVLKYWQYNYLLALQADGNKEVAAAKVLKELRDRQKRRREELLGKAQSLAPLVTEPSLKRQLEALKDSIEAGR